MATAAFDHLQLLLQMLQTTRNLASNMRVNASTWLAAAQNQSIPQPTLQQQILDAGTSYRNIITEASAFISANNAMAVAATALIGATIADLSAYAAPLSTVANGIATANLSTYAAIITGCNSILSTVPAPPTLYTGE